MGGVLKAQQAHLFEHDRVTRRAMAAMASRRGFIEAGGGDTREVQGENQKGEKVNGEKFE